MFENKLDKMSHNLLEDNPIYLFFFINFSFLYSFLYGFNELKILEWCYLKGNSTKSRRIYSCYLLSLQFFRFAIFCVVNEEHQIELARVYCLQAGQAVLSMSLEDKDKLGTQACFFILKTLILFLDLGSTS